MSHWDNRRVFVWQGQVKGLIVLEHDTGGKNEGQGPRTQLNLIKSGSLAQSAKPRALRFLDGVILVVRYDMTRVCVAC